MADHIETAPASQGTRILRGDPGPTLVAASIMAALFLLLYLLAVRTAWGQSVDAASLGYAAPWRPFLSGLADFTHRWLPTVLGLAAIAFGVMALATKRWRRVLSGLLIVAVAGFATEVLKSNLPRPYLGDFAYPINTFPSGHTSAAAALVVAILLMWPGRPPAVAVRGGAALVFLAAVSTVITYAHRASDPLGSILLVGVVTLATCLLLRNPLLVTDPSGRDRPGSQPEDTVRGRRRRARPHRAD